MKVFGTPDLECASTRCRIVRCDPDGSSHEDEANVQLEHTLLVYVNGEPTLRIVCTPKHLFDLVVGRLFTQGIIAGVADIESIRLENESTEVYVTLANAEANSAKSAVETTPTTGQGNRVLNTYFEHDVEPAKVTPISWEPAWIFSLARQFAAGTPMHSSTFGTHSCYLAQESEVLFCCEDLGRHNAFDKVIGFALRNGIDLSRSIIFSSGRLPVDMIAKGIRAGVPILVSKAVPTAKTIELAEEYDLTLICSARPDSMNVFNDPMGVCQKSERL